MRLGFISERINENNYKEKANNVYELWKNLGGENKNHVTLNNLRIFLLAIMGTFVEPGLNKDD